MQSNHTAPIRLVSGAEGATSYDQLRPGTVVNDEFGRLYGIVEGRTSRLSLFRESDERTLMVIVKLDPSYPHQNDEGAVVISGRYLQPVVHGPEDAEPARHPDIADCGCITGEQHAAARAAWQHAWDAWYERVQTQVYGPPEPPVEVDPPLLVKLQLFVDPTSDPIKLTERVRERLQEILAEEDDAELNTRLEVIS
jgi:hypothetical protein